MVRKEPALPEERTGTLQFSVDARHLRQLGRELVADSTTAVAELVKNAYDADATRVSVAFRDATANAGGKLTIEDDGQGMTLADIESSWMRISTPIKEREPRTVLFDRIRAGKKGIGRFAAESLGRRLLLSSTVAGSPEAVEVEFNWDREYEDGTDLEDIRNHYKIVIASKDEHWTRLEIHDLREAWTDKGLADLQKAVVLLQPPFPPSSARPRKRGRDPGFKVTIERDGNALEEHEGFEPFLDSATAVVSGRVDKRGRGTWAIESQRFDLEDTSTASKPLLTTGTFNFRAYYFIHDRTAIGSIGVALSREMGNLYGGVRLYRDGLRVPPFGDQGDDWLTLDLQYRRREKLFPISNNNWFGVVAISRDENLLLIDTASREGVIENDAFEELRGFVREGLIWGAQRVAAARNRKQTASGRRGTGETPASRARIVDEAFGRTGEAFQLAKTGNLRAAKRELAAAEQAIKKEARREDTRQQRETKRLLRELQVLRLLASLGTSIIVFSHEVRGVLSSLRSQISDIEEAAAESPSGSVLERIASLAQFTGSSLDTLSQLTSYIEGFASGTTRRILEPQPLHDVIEGFIKGVRPLLERRGVVVTWEVVPPHLRTCPMHRAELEAVLFNLLTNSIKAMDVEGQGDRAISVSAGLEDGAARIRFEDNGHGVNEKVRSTLFDAFVTTSPPGESMLGAGTGLGLKVVSDIVHEARGSVSLGDPGDGFSTCFVVRVPAMKG